MRCVNPICRTETNYFRSGSLHCIDRNGHGAAGAGGEQRQLVWLCPACSLRFVVETWRPPGQQLVPLRGPLMPHSQRMHQGSMRAA